MATLADGLAELLEALDKMEIPYSIGGSVASTFYGLPRATNDVDLVARMTAEQLDELADILKDRFYADVPMMRKAMALGRAFNVIHYASAYKFDIFPLKNDEYSRMEFSRRAFRSLKDLGQPIECSVASAEDTILRKLEWYRLGGETSERQWHDVWGVVKIAGDKLDWNYLRHWAQFLKVDDLLERLLAEIRGQSQ